MNSTFREYVFGRSFNLSLSERHVDALAALCRNEALADYGLGGSMNGLLRRGLVQAYVDAANRARFRPTRAGLLVYDLMVEAGEHAALEDRRRATLEAEHREHQAEWDRRFANITITLKEKHLRVAPPSPEPAA